MTATLKVRSGPDKFALLMSLGEKHEGHSRMVIFRVEGLLYQWWNSMSIRPYEKPRELSTDEQVLYETYDEHRDYLTPTQEIAAYINGMTYVTDDNPDTWDLTGTLHGSSLNLFGRRRPDDLDFRARFSTRTRKGSFEFIYPDLDPMKALRDSTITRAAA